MSGFELVVADIHGSRDAFTAVLSDKSISFEREAEFAIQAISATDYLTKVALANRQSVVNAVTNIAAIGISLNPAKKQAYLVPRKGVVCLDISYMGMLDLAMDSGSIKWGQCRLVRENDAFALGRMDELPAHTYNPFAKNRGIVVGVYAVVKTCDGDYLTHAMSIDEVLAIRDRSESWKAFVEKKVKSPWVTDEGEMIKKTCIKQAYKYWPKTERLQHAIHHLNTDGGEGLEDINVRDMGHAEVVPKTLPGLAGKAFERALAAVKSKDYSVTEIEKTYSLTDDQKTALADAEKEIAK